MSFQLRQGSNLDRMSVVFDIGEIVYTTDTKGVYVGDGTTLGGNEIGARDYYTSEQVDLMNSNFTTLTSFATHADNESIHFQIDDSAASLTSVWSSSKVASENELKASIDHIHGNITSSGSLTSPNSPVITDSMGVIQAGTFGSTALSFCQGNDPRLSDNRSPTSHSHISSEISDSTSAGRNILTSVDAATQRTHLGLGSAALTSSANYATAAQGARADAAFALLTDIEAALNEINGT